MLEIAQAAVSTELKSEFEKLVGGFYIFENVGTPVTRKSLERLNHKGHELLSQINAIVDEEYQYEIQIEQADRDLQSRFTTLDTEIENVLYEKNKDGFELVPRSISRTQYNEIMLRLNELIPAADQLMDMELRARARFTGSRPVSRQGDPHRFLKIEAEVVHATLTRVITTRSRNVPAETIRTLHTELEAVGLG
jgi:hypothetical protein